jgi:hypothetical protein
MSTILNGRRGASADAIPLRAGPLTMVFEPDTLWLRYVRLGRREVLRAVYVAVRDHNWDTVAPLVTGLEVVTRGDAFVVSFDVRHDDGVVAFAWRGELSGAADGTVRYAMDGRAERDFRRNRIGFCVLHPMAECAGSPCELEHLDGRREDSAFPRAIAPQPYVGGRPRPFEPFADLRSMRHEVTPGVFATVAFEGEAFELEDQRNWTDASFKTYGTPLALPFPVDVAAGTPVRQAVTLTLEGAAEAVADTDASVDVNVGDAIGSLPPIGLGLASDGAPLGDARSRGWRRWVRPTCAATCGRGRATGEGSSSGRRSRPRRWAAAWRSPSTWATTPRPNSARSRTPSGGRGPASCAGWSSVAARSAPTCAGSRWHGRTSGRSRRTRRSSPAPTPTSRNSTAIDRRSRASTASATRSTPRYTRSTTPRWSRASRPRARRCGAPGRSPARSRSSCRRSRSVRASTRTPPAPSRTRPRARCRRRSIRASPRSSARAGRSAASSTWPRGAPPA